jgi:predicted DNA-binding transcriptional regulator YafY
MYDPTMRVLTVLEVLQAKERVTGEELERRLEVSRRTVQRYVARLQDLGVPVESSRGVGGAYRLRPGFRLPPMMFTEEEAFALTLGLQALRQLGLTAMAPASEGAAAKLSRVLPQPVRERVVAVEEAVALETSPWIVPTDAETVLRVAEAIRARHTVTFDYTSHERASSKRTVDPYGLVHLGGRWYLVGYCHTRDDLRTFRLDRVTEVVETPDAFTRPEAFDARAYLLASLPFVMSLHETEVWLDLPIERARSRFMPWRVSLQEENGGTRLRCARDALEPFAAMLLGLGCEVRVVRPAALREAFAALAQRAASAAGTGEPPAPGAPPEV